MAVFDPVAIRQGDRIALSRALTALENDQPDGDAILADLFPNTGKAHLIGITGSPGTGKSTLVNQLVRAMRGIASAESPRVAIIAVDPSSPFTGGALLGDRIRMQDLASDQGIFMRSMASRGAQGGLAHRTAALTMLLDGAGYDIIVIETVGAGQAEVDVAQLAHTVVVVDAPGLGDDIQAIKAGILEIADILVVNKADRPDAESAVRALQIMLHMAQAGNQPLAAGKHSRMASSDQPTRQTEPIPEVWQTPVLTTIATEGSGIDALIAALHQHRDYLHRSGQWAMKDADRLQNDLERLIQQTLMSRWQQTVNKDQYQQVLAGLLKRQYSPKEALQQLL